MTRAIRSWRQPSRVGDQPSTPIPAFSRSGTTTASATAHRFNSPWMVVPSVIRWQRYSPTFRWVSTTSTNGHSTFGAIVFTGPDRVTYVSQSGPSDGDMTAVENTVLTSIGWLQYH